MPSSPKAPGGRSPPGIHPNQFLGLELNPRAAVIAELVLWIGWLRHRLANHPDAIGDPVLPTLSNINGGAHGGYDAVLVRRADGSPDTENPRRPDWPEADFIVGNPPFIGGKDLRARLGAEYPGYAEALWAANPDVPPSADLVMHWWNRAADILTRPGTRLRRFGFVTTNSITQVFSRRVIERHLGKAGSTPSSPSPPRGEGRGEGLSNAPAPPTVNPATPANIAPGTAPLPDPLPNGEREKNPLSLVFAVPDHPWITQPRTDGRRRPRAEKGPAAVRIAMTVAQVGEHEGRLVEITHEDALDTDLPRLATQEVRGRINADLTIGTDVTAVVPLRANEGVCSPGVKLHGDGFIVTPRRGRGARARQAPGAGGAYPSLPQRPRPPPTPARRHGHRPVRAGGKGSP
ncbi:DNA methyltransferase [uncultured Sphingomonas sp.]|uniref:DNA methyltransferase n=1 Tax=uncultured Sphingomonas sp. TaxID=158754 RepID=UPI0035CBEA6A